MTSDPIPPSRSSLREVAWLSLAGAIVVSLVDATLIQIRKELFTGGFLAEDTLTSRSDQLAFGFGSPPRSFFSILRKGESFWSRFDVVLHSR